MGMHILIASICIIFNQSILPNHDVTFENMPNFDISMSNHITPSKLAPGLYAPQFANEWQLLKDLYEKNNSLHDIPQASPKIPKIIHHIWLGCPLPQRYKKYLKSWQKLHPDWKHKLWTDADLKNFKLNNQAIFDKAENYGERSDIWRYEILYRYGGLYVDTDIECLKPFDTLHYNYDFYAGIMSADIPFVNNALIGASPKHPILKLCIASMQKDGPTNGTIERTGPAHFTRCFFKLADRLSQKVIAFPLSFFYAIPIRPAHYTNVLQVTKWIRPETKALHYWANSWAGPGGVVKKQNSH